MLRRLGEGTDPKGAATARLHKGYGTRPPSTHHWVNHDILMARVARRVNDRRVLRLIRRYLQSGMMADGVVVRTEEGTPQGGLCEALHKPPYAE